jgi:hypothetical protein
LQVGDADYGGYVDQIDKVRNELAALRTTRWTEELYWNWLYVYRAMVQDKTSSYPDWMRTSAWKRKELQAMFGSWVSVRHDAAPPAEPEETTQEEGESGPVPPWGYVEPQPEVYARLATLTRMIIDGLEDRSMLSGVDRGALLELELWLILMQDVARRELTGQALTAEEYQRLSEYGSMLQGLTRMAAGSESDASNGVLGADPLVPVSISVAASEEMRRIEATGPVDEIYVVIERDREPYLARGGVYSHYEFARPLEDPLTEAVWREMLQLGEQPPRPEWMDDLISE